MHIDSKSCMEHGLLRVISRAKSRMQSFTCKGDAWSHTGDGVTGGNMNLLELEMDKFWNFF